MIGCNDGFLFTDRSGQLKYEKGDSEKNMMPFLP